VPKIVDCEKCRKKISDDTSTCPYFGNHPRKTKRFSTIWLAIPPVTFLVVYPFYRWAKIARGEQEIDAYNAVAIPAKLACFAVAILMLGTALLIFIIKYAISHSKPQPVTAEGGSGRYQIIGVDRITKRDVTDFIEAISAENAKAKAELSGIVVTRVERA